LERPHSIGPPIGLGKPRWSVRGARNNVPRRRAGLPGRRATNKANAVSALGDKRAAVALYEQVIGIYKRLVEQEGRRDLVNELARAYLNKASSAAAGWRVRHAAVCRTQRAAEFCLRTYVDQIEARNDVALFSPKAPPQAGTKTVLPERRTGGNGRLHDG